MLEVYCLRNCKKIILYHMNKIGFHHTILELADFYMSKYASNWFIIESGGSFDYFLNL